MTPISIRSVLKEKEIWILASIVIFYFFPILFLGETLYYRDLSLHFLPVKMAFVFLMERGEPPLWNPFDNEAFWAIPNHIPLYPSNIFYLFFPVIRTFNWDIVIHLIFCGVAAYLFSRILRIGRRAALLCGLVYGFSGLMLAVIGQVNQFLSMPEIPLIFGCWHLFLITHRKKYFVAAALFGLLQFIGGGPEIPFGVFVSLLGWTYCFPYEGISAVRKTVLWLVLFIFMMGLSAIQLVPMLDLVADSPRGRGIGYAAFTTWSLDPKRLPEMLIPSFLGRVSSLDPADYWGTNLESGGEPLYLSIYFGSTVLALAFLGGIRTQDDSAIPFRCRQFLAVMILVLVFFSLGNNLPFFELLHRFFPPVRLVRYPSKLLLFTIFPIAILAANSLDLYFGQRRITPSKKVLLFLWSFPVIFGILIVLFVWSGSFSEQFQRFFFEEAPHPKIRQQLLASLWHTLILSVGPVLLFQYRDRLTFKFLASWGIILVIATDLLVAGNHINPSAPEEFLNNPPPAARIVRERIQDGRLFPARDPGRLVMRAPSNDAIWYIRWELELLLGYASTFYHIPIAFYSNIANMTPAHLKDHYELVDRMPWNMRLPFLSAAGVQLIITREKLNMKSLELLTNLPNSSNAEYYLYRNPAAVPRINFVTTWINRSSDAKIVQAMLSPGFDPNKHVVLQNADSNLVHRDCPKADLDIYEAKTHSVRLSVKNSCDGYLVFSEPYYPGWYVHADGKQVPVLKANAAFSAVFLPAGNHKVERFYRPLSIPIGIAISFIFGLLLVIIKPQHWIGNLAS